MIVATLLAALIALAPEPAPGPTPAPAPAAAQELSLPADPLSHIEGEWHDQRKKVTVRVTNGRAVITSFETGWNFGHMPYAEGREIAVLTGGAADSHRSFRFTGECLDLRSNMHPDGRLIPCGPGAGLTAYRHSDGRVYYRLSLPQLDLYRRADISASEWNARR